MGILPHLIGAVLAGTGIPTPTTLLVNSATFRLATLVPTNSTTNAARVAVPASGVFFYSESVTGTDCTLTAYQNTSTVPAGMVEVSINGAAFAAAPIVAGKYVIFSGQPHAARSVAIRLNAGFGTANCWVPATGTVMSITGTPPSVALGTTVLRPHETSALAATAGLRSTTWLGAGYNPPVSLPPRDGSTMGSAVYGYRFKAPGATKMRVNAMAGGRVYISKNGAEPVSYPIPSSAHECITMDLDGSDAIYNVWPGFIYTEALSARRGSWRYGGISVDASLADIGAKKLLFQVGDSITDGSTGYLTGVGEVDCYGTAAALGFVGASSGIAGNTTAQLKARIDTVLAALSGITSADVFVLAIGRNGAYTAGTWEADYAYIVNAALAKGFGRVLCRCTPEAGNATLNGWISQLSAWVTALADPRVKWVDTLTDPAWAAVNKPDTTHPSNLGYAQLRALCIAAYPALIA